MYFVGIVDAPFNTARLCHKLKINRWIILVQFVETTGNQRVSRYSKRSQRKAVYS